MVLLTKSAPIILALFGLVSNVTASPDLLQKAIHKNLDAKAQSSTHDAEVEPLVRYHKNTGDIDDDEVTGKDLKPIRRSIDLDSFSDSLLRRQAPPTPEWAKKKKSPKHKSSKPKSECQKLVDYYRSTNQDVFADLQAQDCVKKRELFRRDAAGIAIKKKDGKSPLSNKSRPARPSSHAECRKLVDYYKSTHQDTLAELQAEECPSKRDLFRRDASPANKKPANKPSKPKSECQKMVDYYKSTNQDVDARLMAEGCPSKRELEEAEFPGPLVSRSDIYSPEFEYSVMLTRRMPKGGRMRSGPGAYWMTSQGTDASQNQSPQPAQRKRSFVPEAGLYRRDAMVGGAGRVPRARPRPETAAQKAADAAAQKRKDNAQHQQDSAALQRVDQNMQQSQSQAQSTMSDAHAECQKLLAIEDKQEKQDTAGLARLNREILKLPEGNKKVAMQRQIKYLQDRKDHKVYQYNRLQDLQGETQKDFEAMKTFNQQANDAQHAEFNDNGSSKSEAQKEAERALAGFMKFLHIFGEILSALSSIIPGEGEILNLGIKLGEIGADAAKAAKVGEQVANIAKGINKANSVVKDVNDLQKYLGITPGKQQIQGMNGQTMQKWQNWMLNQLYSTMSKNLAEDSKNLDPSVHVAQPFGNLQYPPHKDKPTRAPPGAYAGPVAGAMRAAMR